jgi:hypothetical protein
MQHQPITDPSHDDAQLDARVLDLLVHDHVGLWSLDELRQLLGDPAEDSLARLHGLGLIHRLDGYVFASRAAAHMHQLAS